MITTIEDLGMDLTNLRAIVINSTNNTECVVQIVRSLFKIRGDLRHDLAAREPETPLKMGEIAHQNIEETYNHLTFNIRLLLGLIPIDFIPEELKELYEPIVEDLTYRRLNRR